MECEQDNFKLCILVPTIERNSNNQIDATNEVKVAHIQCGLNNCDESLIVGGLLLFYKFSTSSSSYTFCYLILINQLKSWWTNIYL